MTCVICHKTINQRRHYVYSFLPNPNGSIIGGRKVGACEKDMSLFDDWFDKKSTEIEQRWELER